MHTLSKGLLGFVVLVAILGIGILVMFHLGGVIALRTGQLAPLLGAFLGGGLVLIKVALPTTHTGARDWKGRERISWVLASSPGEVERPSGVPLSLLGDLRFPLVLIVDMPSSH